MIAELSHTTYWHCSHSHHHILSHPSWLFLPSVLSFLLFFRGDNIAVIAELTHTHTYTASSSYTHMPIILTPHTWHLKSSILPFIGSFIHLFFRGDNIAVIAELTHMSNMHPQISSHPPPSHPVIYFLFFRGDNIAVIAELDETIDAGQDLSSIRACPLKPVTH